MCSMVSVRSLTGPFAPALDGSEKESGPVSCSGDMSNMRHNLEAQAEIRDYHGVQGIRFSIDHGPRHQEHDRSDAR